MLRGGFNVGSNAISLVVHQAATNVSANTQTTILTYSASGDKKVVRIGCGGDDYAKFQVYINTVLVETKRTGPDRHIDFNWCFPLELNDGDVIDVKVTHYFDGDNLNFEATLYGY